ncbi:hypothetical protein IE53DRAFT_269758 [Violaceomyces palustris]|uniref:Uncharacterized protein n=1 Tax=Violaceomyces palustris TaxID=1673888 RepID=A0ACD0NMX8_9BASI|nr:hypothetical protein IE53DRAFT_269758 [Violaceomyces palustris]
MCTARDFRPPSSLHRLTELRSSHISSLGQGWPQPRKGGGGFSLALQPSLGSLELYEPSLD